MGTSFVCSDVWDCLGGRTLVMIGRWKVRVRVKLSMTLSFYFDFAEEKTKPTVLCKSWLKGKFPACVMTIILIVANVARRRVLFVDPVASKNIEDGFQVSVVHSFV